jgi:pyruvate dehydrogenase E2 component (dihydrolipoamide acetyltransferase)
MAIEFKVPELGENITGGDIINVLVKEGDTISAGQDVFEIETGKAVVPVSCPHAGRVAKIMAAAGTHVEVGAVLMTVEAGSDTAAPSSSAPAPSSAGTNGGGHPTIAQASSGASAPPDADSDDEDSPLPAGPAARRVARELGVDLGRVRGSGPRGRITPEDVRAAAPGGSTATMAPAAHAHSAPATAPIPPAAPSPGPAPGAAPKPGVAMDDRYGPIRKEPLTQIRRTIAAQMVKSATTIPHVTNFDDADITELDRIRKGVRPGQFGANVKLTLLPFVMKAISLALKSHPLLNAQIDEENQQIIYKDYIHLGIAVDTPRGLVVPVLRNIDRMTIPEIARALASIAERSRSAQFSNEDLRGGTFTVSNLGAVGGTYSTPIINHPEVAILLLGRSRQVAVFREGQFEPRLMLPLSVSYDHRVIDGAAAARFLNQVIELLLSPAQLLLAE